MFVSVCVLASLEGGGGGWFDDCVPRGGGKLLSPGSSGASGRCYL